jgi:hypothetical protein
LLPLIVTTLPTPPVPGVTVVIDGAAAAATITAVNADPAVAWKPGPSTIWFPAVNVAPAPPPIVKPLDAVMLCVA